MAKKNQKSCVSTVCCLGLISLMFNFLFSGLYGLLISITAIAILLVIAVIIDVGRKKKAKQGDNVAYTPTYTPSPQLISPASDNISENKEVKFCPFCGNDMNAGAKFCSNCGQSTD